MLAPSLPVMTMVGMVFSLIQAPPNTAAKKIGPKILFAFNAGPVRPCGGMAHRMNRPPHEADESTIAESANKSASPFMELRDGLPNQPTAREVTESGS